MRQWSIFLEMRINIMLYLYWTILEAFQLYVISQKEKSIWNINKQYRTISKQKTEFV